MFRISIPFTISKNQSYIRNIHLLLYTTGAQEWHIVSPLADVTSTTVAHHVSMTSEYVFWAQRSTDRRADSTRCTQKSAYSARSKYIVRHWTSREASLHHSSGWGTWSASPHYRDFRNRALYIQVGTKLKNNTYLASKHKLLLCFKIQLLATWI